MPPRRRKAAGKPRDLYAELGLSTDASSEDIKRAYRALALEHHPDKVPSSERDAATAKLASINTAWDVLGDAERRRVYDLQRDADGGGASSVGLRHGGLALVRRHILGAEARSFPWTSGVPYLQMHSVGKLQRAMSQKKPILLFLHLGGSPRSEKAAPAIVTAHSRLRGAVLVAAVDAAAEPKLAQMLQPSNDPGASDGSTLPSALLIGGEHGARHFEPPLNASKLIAAALELMPELSRVCTLNQLRGLREAARGAHGRNAGVPVMAVALSVRGGSTEQVSIHTGANPRLVACRPAPCSLL